MSPPTEQLIRDYLTRLSVAARGQLGPEDRRALVNRTRDFIERETSLAGPPTAMEVATLLAGLGDPSGLVRQERQRLTAMRGELPDPAAGRRGRLARALRRDPGRVRGASWHWPTPEGRPDLQVTLIDGGESEADATDDGAVRGAPADAHDRSNGAAPNGTAAAASAFDVTAGDAGQSSVHVPAQAREPSWFLLALGGDRQAYDGDAEAVEPDAALSDAGPADTALSGTALSGTVLSGTALIQTESGSAASAVAQQSAANPAWQLTTPPDPLVPRLARRTLKTVAAWYRRNPLEAASVTLIGLGGVIFPPTWVLGAALALASRLWDYVDKWIGLALPPVVTIIGVAVGIANGGHVSMGQSVHEAWVYGVAASRIAAVLSGCYLGWRTGPGRRPPAAPPWNRPHKIG
jgi:hypothetical protein